ncbi:MAG: hypothetical protein HQK96_08860, partial [Nitrospirae bacterium]|nr:hypothetical protein [Nitrospirota bacterium]
EEEIELVVQINGKVRAKEKISAALDDEAKTNIALNNEKIRELTAGKQVERVMVQRGMLVNIVIKK